MDTDSWVKLGGTGVLGTYGIKVLVNWLSRERQEYSLYQTELKAHEQTKGELEHERKLRKDAEMELQEVRRFHDEQRDEWDRQRDEDRALREALKDQVFNLRTDVNRLSDTLKANGIKLT